MQARNTPVERLAQADLLLLIAREFAGSSATLANTDVPTLRELSARAGLGTGTPLIAFMQLRSATGDAQWRRERTRLFEGPAPCPANETAYVRRDKGVLLADISGFYRAFGFEASEASGEKPDHVVIELQFTAMLLVMLARAEDAGRESDVETTGRSLRAFAEDHIGAWLTLFCERLNATAQLEAMNGLADLLAAVWQALATELRLSSSGLPVFSQPNQETGTPYECGRCPAVTEDR